VLLSSDDVLSKEMSRKAVVVLSDGVDSGSKTSLDRAVQSAQKTDTLVYSIRYFDRGAYKAIGGFGRGRGTPSGDLPDGKAALEKLARQTGGSYFEVSDNFSNDDIYRRIEQELRNQYSLGYTSDRTADGAEYRKIQVTVNREGATVHARDGYYARS
jgi:VWFA-related protein